MRVVIYSRVSTDAQERDGTSLDTQESACRDFARDAGWEIVDAIREAASGASLARVELERAREMARSGKANVLLCYAVDRLSRDQLGVGVVLAEAEDFGYRLEFVNEKFENTSIGKFIMNTRAFAAELEREKILERTTRGKTQRAKSGRIPQATGRGIYGYSYDPSTGTRSVDPAMASVVSRVFDEFVSGLGTNRIANRLNNEGIPAFAGGRWYSLTVRRILLNETYTGRTVYRRTRVDQVRDPRTGKKRRRVTETEPSEWIEIPEATPAIVSAEVYSAAKAILSSPERRLRGRPSQHYRLTGRARCLKCDTPMTGQVLMKGRYSYYRCRNSFTSTASTRCDARYVRKELLEDSVRDTLVDVLTDPDRLAVEVLRFFTSKPSGVDAAQVAQSLRRVDEKQRRVARMLIQGDIPESILAVHASQLKRERQQLEAQLSSAPTKPTVTATTILAQLPAMSGHVRAWVQNAQGEDVELLLRALDVRVTASSERAFIHASVPFRESVQKLNLVTTERTWASPRARTPAR